MSKTQTTPLANLQQAVAPAGRTAAADDSQYTDDTRAGSTPTRFDVAHDPRRTAVRRACASSAGPGSCWPRRTREAARDLRYSTRPWRAADAGRRAERCRRCLAGGRAHRRACGLGGRVVREVGMRVLTLTQPWATLVAIGAKRIETRSWAKSIAARCSSTRRQGWGRLGGIRGSPNCWTNCVHKGP